MVVGAAVLSGCSARGEGHPSRMASLMPVGRRPQFLRAWACLQGCLSFFRTQWLADPRVWEPRGTAKKKPSRFYDLAPGVTLAISLILFVRSESVNTA